MNIKLYIQWGDVLPNGEVHWQRKRLCKSFLKQFMQFMEIALCHNYGGGSTTNILDTSNTLRTISAWYGIDCFYTYKFLGTLAELTNANYGIVVGTGVNAVTTSDYALQTPIANGAGAGQLSYGLTGYVGTVTLPGSCTLQLTRTFINNSGGDITVKEIALVCASGNTVAVECYFCLTRDLQTQLIAAGGSKIAVISIVTAL